MLESSRETMRKGSRSFWFASLLLGRRVRDHAFLLYSWCRYCDDQVDGQELGRTLGVQDRTSSSSDPGLIGRLRSKTHLAFESRLEASDAEAFRALCHVANECRIPERYAQELIDGMEADINGTRYESIEELERYAYQVAGTVGLMMSHVMGVRSPEAYLHAADLGRALQLTNIARDVMDDARIGRVYLPQDWLKDEGVLATPVAILAPENRAAVSRVVARLVRHSERYYESGFNGLRFLRWRSALAVAVAGEVYRAIGIKVLKQGERAWDSRAVVPGVTKLSLLFKALARLPWLSLMRLSPRALA